jgi:hypothetical protein
VVLEVVGDMVPWMGAAVGNVCVTAETAACCDEDGPLNTHGYAEALMTAIFAPDEVTPDAEADADAG